MTTKPIHISKLVARRFVLGRQGLWPGRRWAGKQGTIDAMRAVEFTQLDPLRPVARAHDLMLHSRVHGYREGMFEEVTYKDRLFFDWGGWLAAMPMEELPYWRVIMERSVVGKWGTAFVTEHADVIERVRADLREKGPLMNRDFEAGKAFKGAYRSAKDTGLALFYLWIKGEVMTYDRRQFQRVYHFRETVAPSHLCYVADECEADRMVALKLIAASGFAKPIGFATHLKRSLDKVELAKFSEDLVQPGAAIWVTADGHGGERLMLAADLPNLETLANGQIPEAWSPIKETTEDEAVFLSPLDMVSARGRAKPLFDFDYVWEVYKPAHLRRWGYYTMPILYEDRLVGRIEPRMDRKTNTLHFDGLWLDDPATAKSASFKKALKMGVKRFAKFANAKSVDASGIADESMRKLI